MLNYTGHPLIDIGIATITAFAERYSPDELTEADLDQVSEYLVREYTRQPLKSFATVPFTGGAYFTQPAYTGKDVEMTGTQKILTAYKKDVPVSAEQCVFTNKPALGISLDEKGTLPIGRASRSNIPLITGATVINFYPYGELGLPVSGEALLAIHAYPLGCAKCGGRLLGVHSNNEDLMLHFARKFLEHNQQSILLAQQSGSKKLPEAPYAYRTLLIDTLLNAKRMQGEARYEDESASVTAYHLSNSGQGVDLDMYHLPMQVVNFLQEMGLAIYRQDWQNVVNRAWEVAPPQKKRQKEAIEPFKPRRNWLYEDLFSLPETAKQFVRTYFLRVPLRDAKSNATDPRDAYAIKTEVHLISWTITAKFLERIMLMDKARITKIREMGDALAQYVKTQNDRRFFQNFYNVRRYDGLRLNLIKASKNQIKNGHPPLIDFDTFIAVFEDEEDLPRLDWSLVRDLVLIRMMEQLHKLDWLGKNTDVLPDSGDEVELSD